MKHERGKLWSVWSELLLGGVTMHWQVQEAKRRFSELIRAAKNDGAQFITRHGEEEAVMLSVSDYRRLAGVPSFKDLLRELPYGDSPDTSDLRRALPRQVDLGFE